MCCTAVAPTTIPAKIDHLNRLSTAPICGQALLTQPNQVGSPGNGTRDLITETRPARRTSQRAVKTLSSLGRTLVLLPHPGDEAACAGLLQRSCEPIVAVVTNDAAEVQGGSSMVATHRKYAIIRQQEALKALPLAGVHQVEFLSDYPYLDKFCAHALCDVLPLLFAAVHTLIRRHRPDSLLVPAYEGGHPDHDVCSFVGAMVRQWMQLPIWEMPLYHASDSGEIVSQRFREPNGSELMYPLTSAELHTRAAMLSCYASERDSAAYITGAAEYFRPQEKYDYSLPVPLGTDNVTAWAPPPSAVDSRRQLAQYAYNSGMPPGAVFP